MTTTTDPLGSAADDEVVIASRQIGYGPYVEPPVDWPTGGFYIGTAGNDGYIADKDSSMVFAMAGDDAVVTGSGGDIVSGGDGNDLLFAGDGDDFVFGDAGKDVLLGGNGSDWIEGGAGNDTINGGREEAGDDAYAIDRDTVHGGDGDDLYLWGLGAGSDYFSGDAGDDTLYIDNLDVTLLDRVLVLDYDDSFLRRHYDAATRTLTYLDEAGNAASFSGEIRYGEEAMRFSSISEIVLAF